MPYNPLLSYPLEQIDPGATFSREEASMRLPHMRAALYQLKRGGQERLCEPSGADTLVAALSPAPRLHPSIHASIFSKDTAWTPRVCLIAPTARVFSPQHADAMSENERVQCIPIEGDARGSVAFPHWPIAAPKRVLVHFDAQRVGVGGHASLAFHRAGVDKLEVQAISSNGARTEWSGTVAEPVLDKLFETSWGTVLRSTPERVPAKPGELPQTLMDEVADFWQRWMRCHVVASVCAPDDATRPLGFASIRAKREGSQHKRAVVRAKLHRSSCACACDLWNHKPVYDKMPSERFVGSEVELALGMCGRPLDPRTKLCPLHGEATPSVPLLEDICCHGAVAELQCSHQTQTKRPPIVGLRQADMRLRGHNVLHAQVLIAACLRCADAVGPMLGKRPTAEVLKVCDSQCTAARLKLDALSRKRVAHDEILSDEAMLVLDVKAHDLLVQGGVRQHERPSTKRLVLAKTKPDGSTVVLKQGEGAELLQTHLGLFPPPPKTRKRKAS